MDNGIFIDQVLENRLSKKKKKLLQLVDMTSSLICFGFTVFFLLILITGTSFMSISGLVLKLYKLSFIED